MESRTARPSTAAVGKPYSPVADSSFSSLPRQSASPASPAPRCALLRCATSCDMSSSRLWFVKRLLAIDQGSRNGRTTPDTEAGIYRIVSFHRDGLRPSQSFGTSTRCSFDDAVAGLQPSPPCTEYRLRFSKKLQYSSVVHSSIVVYRTSKRICICRSLSVRRDDAAWPCSARPSATVGIAMPGTFLMFALFVCLIMSLYVIFSGRF